MGQGKGGRGFDHHTEPANQQHQCDDEQQVVIAFEDVDDPQHEIAARHFPAIGNERDLNHRLVLGQAGSLNRSAQRGDPQQRIGEGGVHAGQTDLRSGQVPAAGQAALRNQHQPLNPRLRRGLGAEIGEGRLGPGGETAQNRCLPDQFPVLGILLGEFEITRAQLISLGWQGQQSGDQDQQYADQARHLGCSITTS